MSDSEENWIDIGDVDDFPLGAVREIIAGGKVLAVGHSDAGIHALDGLCPHQGGPLGKGSLCGEILVCPWHGFSFEMSTGFCTSSKELVQPHFEVRILGRRVVVQVGGD